MAQGLNTVAGRQRSAPSRHRLFEYHINLFEKRVDDDNRFFVFFAGGFVISSQVVPIAVGINLLRVFESLTAPSADSARFQRFEFGQ